MWLTFLIIGAFVALGLAKVWCTVLRDQVSVLTEETMEERPTTITTLVHIVTGHKMLSGELWHVFSIFDLKTVLRNLGERDGIA